MKPMQRIVSRVSLEVFQSTLGYHFSFVKGLIARTRSPSVHYARMFSSHSCLVAVTQFTAGTDKEKNFNICEQLIQEGHSRGAKVS